MDDAKFDVLYSVLKDLQDAGVLKHFVLVGSWCQEFYRHHFENSFEIPATRTMDADILIPRRTFSLQKSGLLWKNMIRARKLYDR